VWDVAKSEPSKPVRVPAISLRLTCVGWQLDELELEGDRVVVRKSHEADVGASVMSKVLLWWQRVTGQQRELPTLGGDL
jgi:hypothetical protein